MSTVAAAAVGRAMEQLREGARAQRDAITELKRLGVLRSRGLVCDLGEALAARLYGVELEPPSTPGFDLVDGDGARVQVRTLRCTPENWRTKVGRMKEPYDKLLAIRLDEHYEPSRPSRCRARCSTSATRGARSRGPRPSTSTSGWGTSRGMSCAGPGDRPLVLARLAAVAPAS